MALNHLYPDQSYVYAIMVDGIARYVGKGTGRRAWIHRETAALLNRKRRDGKRVKTQRLYNRLAKALRDGRQVEEVILVDGLTSAQAFEQESVVVDSYPKGQLWNEMPGGRGFSSEHVRDMWTRPEFRAAMAKSDPERLKRLSVETSRNWSDPDVRARREAGLKLALRTDTERQKRSERMLKVWSTEEYRSNASKAQKDRWSSVDSRKRQGDAIRAKWADPEWVERHKAAVKEKRDTEDYGKRRSAIMKAKWADPEYRNKVTVNAAIGRRRQIAESIGNEP